MTGEELSKIFSLIANGDRDAEAFCHTVYHFFHLIDDLYDGDKDRRTPDEVAGYTAATLETFMMNPFVQAHREQILGVLRVSAFQWIHSERLKSGDRDVKNAVVAEVLKSAYQEIFYLVASLTGGIRHAIEMGTKFRDYDFG